MGVERPIDRVSKVTWSVLVTAARFKVFGARAATVVGQDSQRNFVVCGVLYALVADCVARGFRGVHSMHCTVRLLLYTGIGFRSCPSAHLHVFQALSFS